jgi:hypothetical protein
MLASALSLVLVAATVPLAPEAPADTLRHLAAVVGGGAARGTLGSYPTVTAGIGLRLGHWEARVSGVATFETLDCLGTCPRRLGPLISVAAIRRVMPHGPLPGLATGVLLGYAFGRKAAAVGANLSYDWGLGSGGLLRLEAVLTQALASARLPDPLLPGTSVRQSNRQFAMSLSIGLGDWL